MKNFINKCLLGFGVASLMLGMASCDDPEDIGTFEGPNFVAMDKATYSVAENSQSPVVVKVGIASAPVKQDVTVNYTLGGTAVAGEDYTVSGSGSVVVPAGSNTAEITITPTDNGIFEANKTVVVTITSTSNNLPIGLSGNSEATKRASATVTIVNDDCPVIAQEFVGTYNVTYVYVADPASDTSTDVSEITVDPNDENSILITNFWGMGKTVRVNINGCAKSGTIPTQVFESGDFYGYGPAEIQNVKTATIVNTVDPATGGMKLGFRVVVNAGSFGNYSATFTKQ